jgi:hypothetical protein
LLTTFRAARKLTTAVAVATGLVLTAGCSDGSGKKTSVTPVMKASDIADAVSQYKQSFNEEPGKKVCAQLFPTAPTDVVGTTLGGDNVPVTVTMTVLDLTCEFRGADCVAEFVVSPTSSGRDDPKGLRPYNGHYSDSGDDNGIQIYESVGSTTDTTKGCVVSIQTGKTSIQYLNDALGRVSKD